MVTIPSAYLSALHRIHPWVYFFFLSLSKHRFSIIALKFYPPDNIAIMYKCLSTLFIFLHDICTLCSFRVCLFENMYSNCIVPIMYHFLSVIELFFFSHYITIAFMAIFFFQLSLLFLCCRCSVYRYFFKCIEYLLVI